MSRLELRHGSMAGDETGECPHCHQSVDQLTPVLFQNAIEDVACQDCIDVWLAAAVALKPYRAKEQVQ